MTLQNLLAIDRLQPHAADRDAVLKLLGSARRNLADAQVDAIGNDNRFDAAYKCIMQCAMLGLWASGYRTATSQPGHHQTAATLLIGQRMLPIRQRIARALPAGGLSPRGIGPPPPLPYGHSGKLSRLLGCSPSFWVLMYLLPAALTATTTHTDCPLTLTQKRHLPDSIPAMASCWDTFQRVPSALRPPTLWMRSCALERLVLLMQWI